MAGRGYLVFGLALNGEVRMKNIKEIIVEALLADDVRHKQWYLQQLLIKLGFDIKDVRDDVRKKGYDWRDGVSP